MIYVLNERKPQIDDSCFIAPSAVLIGSVNMAANTSIWFNCVLRADNDAINIDENANVQDGSILHTDHGYPIHIKAGVTIGHKVMLHGCTIGENSLVGMNAVVLNGAIVGKNCLIGANALVTENTHIPDGSMVLGSPAKVVRQLDESTIARLRLGSEHYVDNGLFYKKHLQPVVR